MTAIALISAGLSVAGPALGSTAAAGFGFGRLAGADRFATAAMLATQAFPSGASTAIIASRSSFSDALAASYLAGHVGSPILLVNHRLPVPDATLSALRTLKARDVILLGLDGVIGKDVQHDLAATPSDALGGGDLQVSRIGGQDRYDTMNLIDEMPGSDAVGVVGGERTAIVASGVKFADALAAGPVAFARSLPLVLTDPTTLSPAAAQTLSDLGIKQVVVAGGSAAISRGVEAAMNAMGITTLARFAGIDRTDTARLIGDYAIAHLGFSASQFDLASGDDAFGGADALALAPLAARNGARTIQLLRAAGAVGIGAGQFIRDNLATLSANALNTLAGGVAVAPDSTIAPLLTAYNSGTGVTTLPELVSAQIVVTTARSEASASIPGGTLVRFVFDEALTWVGSFSNFRLYDYTHPDDPYPGVGGASNPDSTLDPKNPDAVLVNFPVLTEPTDTLNLSLAAVQAGTVVDEQGSTNPNGSVPIGQLHSLPPSPGSTAAPNAESVGNYRSAPNSATAMDVTFDKPAFSQAGDPDSAGLAIVYADQIGSLQETPCQAPGETNTNPSGTLTPGGNGTTIWTIVCPDDPSTPGSPLVANDVARVVARAGTVGTTAAGENGDVVARFVQANDTPRVVTAGPDLVSAQLEPAAAFGGADAILATFDQGISGADAVPSATPPATRLFAAVLADGTSVPASAVFVSSTDSSEVLATFAVGTDASAVGLAVSAGAVSATAAGSPSNGDDELAAANSPSVVVTPGLTEGPVVESAILSDFDDASGTVLGESVLLTFTQWLAGPPKPPLDGIHGYAPDGTEFTCQAPDVGGGANGFDNSDNPFPNKNAPATLQCDNWVIGASSSGPTATLPEQRSIVLVTVDSGTVANVESQFNPAQAVVAVGGRGTPQQG